MTEKWPFGSKKFFWKICWNRPFCTEDDRKNLKKKFFDRRGPKGNFFQNFFFEFCGQDGWKFCEKYDMEFKLKNRMNVISLQYHTVPCLNDQWRHHRESPSRVTSPSHVTSPSRAIPYGRVLSPSSKPLRRKISCESVYPDSTVSTLNLAAKSIRESTMYVTGWWYEIGNL